MEIESSCEKYLHSKDPEIDDVHFIVLKLLRADPDPNGKNCQWIINSFLENEFLIDEDEETVKKDILKFKEIFGARRPLPEKGYSELKLMIREKEGKKSMKTKVKKSSSKVQLNDCKSFFKNVKNTFPKPYKNYSKEELELLYRRIEDDNPTDVCIWIIKELKEGKIQDQDLEEVKSYITKYFEMENQPLPNFYPHFRSYSNYQLVKDVVARNVVLLSSSDDGILLIPGTIKSSCYYGAQTSWCTSRNEKNKFEYYSLMGNIYIWFDKKLNDKFQFHFENLEFKDRDDNPISKERFKEFLDHPILKYIFNMGLINIQSSQSLKEIRAFAKNYYPDWIYVPYLDKISKDPKYAVKYALQNLNERFLEAEPRMLEEFYYDHVGFGPLLQKYLDKFKLKIDDLNFK